MSSPLAFEVLHRSTQTRARLGRVTTPHGSFDTPAYMAVGTQGAMKGLFPRDVAATGAQILLNNTFHLMLRPGDELVREMGGVHAFMQWDRPILTDSGGYQAYSMADINAIDEDGVTFRSIVDGAEVRLTPERAIWVQNNLGADIIMAFDDCPPSEDPTLGPMSKTKLKLAAKRQGRRDYDHGARLDEALDRTARWLERCKAAHARADEQALFGIVQGGTDETRRARSIEQVCGIELPGYAIGGVAVGESSIDIARVVHFTAPRMPAHRPRYLMGVGYERDIFVAALAGVDMFDCVLPTRNGRSSNAFTRSGQIRLKNARFTHDEGPIDSECDCPACDPAGHGWPTADRGWFSRAYLRHLFIADEMLGPILVSLHNLRHFQRLMLDIREAIAQDQWSLFERAWPVLHGSIPPDVAQREGLATLPPSLIGDAESAASTRNPSE
ncbi:MAG: tRNA guanosine(34) transglycosylase Tgt [Planctomycetota bacterium]